MKSFNSKSGHGVGMGVTERRKLLPSAYHEQMVTLLWTRPVQLSLHLAKVSL